MWFEGMAWRLAVGAVSAALSAVFLAGLLATAAWPRMHAGPNMLEGGHRLQGAVAPLDGAGSFASPAAAYSLRRLKSTYTGPGIKLRRTTGGTQDINFLGFSGFTGAPIDTAAAAAFCNATTCFVDTWYDQSGNNRHLPQATTAAQPQFIFNCKGALPCVQETLVSQNMTFNSVTPNTAAMTMNAVGDHAVRPGGCMYLSVLFGNNLMQHATLDLLQLQATGGINATAAAFAWHSGTGVINGAGSVVNVDGVETTGAAVTVAAGTGPVYFSPLATGATCNQTEMIWWDGYALTQGERAALANNQKSFWGIP